jgi:UDP-N-acetyl-D-mannosaminuronate dehydrogenase
VHNDTAALDLANYLLVGEPEPRYTNVSTAFLMLSDAQRDTLAVLEIGDTITIEKTFNTGTTTTSLAQELAIEGIQHQINLSDGHRMTLFTSPTTLVFELILDDLIYGITDADNVLG